ncbi:MULTISPECIES: phage tail protein [unclassified Stenotrophomonas]|uniref:phage tail protein n=1 Tax=unclassified Stenotrophomonas TaxID=196198 RepID=UPI003713536F
MTTPFIGEIQMFGFDYNPYGWAFCNGTTLPVTQNTVLYSLLGVMYGGNGSSTFQLPNLVTRAACGQGTGPGLTPRRAGDAFGVTAVTLTEQQMPAHQHVLTAFQQGDTTKRSSTPVQGGGLSQPGSSTVKPFSSSPPNAPMSPTMLKPAAGGAQPHANQQPYLAVNFCIALTGDYPSFG